MINRIKTSTLLTLGVTALAVRGVMQLLLDRTGHANNITDFALGVVSGVGFGLLMIVMWRGRGRRGESDGA